MEGTSAEMVELLLLSHMHEDNAYEQVLPEPNNFRDSADGQTIVGLSWSRPLQLWRLLWYAHGERNQKEVSHSMVTRGLNASS